MGLAQFEPETKTLPLPGKSPLPGQPKREITLRGLNVEDLTALVSTRMTQLKQFYELYERSKAEIFASNRTDKFVLALVGHMPNLVAEVISLAADEPGEESVRQARKLPFAFQVVCLGEVVRMTFQEAGGLKNLMAMLASLIEEAVPGNSSARELLASLKVQS